MPPYALSLAKYEAGALLAVSTVIWAVLKIASSLHGFQVVGLYAGGQVIVAVSTALFFYYWQISEVRKEVGIYMPVRDLRSIGNTLAQILRMFPYYEFYARRAEDDLIVTYLKNGEGVVIFGAPYSGKTRTAIEAIKTALPDALLLCFTSADRVSTETFKKIVVPSALVFFRKPKIVVLIDEAQTFARGAFNGLYSQLLGQCSSVVTVATCRSGIAAQSFMDGENGISLHRVELGTLDRESANEIYQNVWKDGVAPLTADVTLPGLILRGPVQLRESYESLPNESRRVITALLLAQTCGTAACDKAFLTSILSDVLGQDTTGLSEMLTDLQTKYIVAVDGRNNVSVSHSEFLLLDYQSYYPTVHEFKIDLEKLETMLKNNKAAARLMYLGLHYWGRLGDLEGARRVFEASITFDQLSLVHVSLARLYAWLNEPELAGEQINAAMGLERDSDKKALTLTLLADEYLINVADGVTAERWYGDALKYATNQDTIWYLNYRRGDCLIRLRRFFEAEQIYRACLKGSSPSANNDITVKLFLSLLALRHNAEARAELTKIWAWSAREKYLQIATWALENAEGFLYDMPEQLKVAADDLWIEYRDKVLELQAKSEIRSLLLRFGESCVAAGFIRAAVPAYAFVIEEAATLEATAGDLFGAYAALGSIFRDLQELDTAAEAFSQARTLAEDKRLASWLGISLAGLADCQLFGGQNIASAREGYRQALEIGNSNRDEVTAGWAQMGLGDINLLERNWQEAKENYSAQLLMPDSVSGQSRVYLGLARAHLELEELDDAETYISQGISRTVHLDYQFRRKQFDELLIRLRAARSAGSAVSQSP